ncbi:SMC family ATPase [Streptomyces sp. NA04227]|uniref:AAA family ATPase n=1 Tax=Streptomyces sp. NA04227 TaxID=2742136 RepID=UPI001590EB13|nr:SMC family ATPase [Streptomyces sp. NA04227]QKW05335.1 SMC family ATPase [Streptomyces sp. NA04227]
MRLHRLSLSAFGPFATTQEIDFDALASAGLFLLHGPTGAGKTSVLDAVCYALYGAVPGARHGGQGMTLRSDHAQAALRTTVGLEFTVAGRRLDITRQPPWERPKKRGAGTTVDKATGILRELDGQGWKALSRSHQEIGEEITQLLGMSRDQFCQVVLLPQGDFARFLRSDAETRGKLLGRLFGTGRFAAVERELADRRRAAEAAVRKADIGLLAEAHRMQQEAGPAAEVPLTEAAPGDPGLATEVLTWAAQARSGAREHLTQARCALDTAEQARQEATQRLDEARELARLQQRAEEARAGERNLAERAEEHRRVEERLARGRKAERVAPVLSLRESAAAAHRRGADAEARARALLPGRFAEAGADELAAAAQAVAKELGALDAARRAERRSTEVARERDLLERQEHADGEALAELDGWLDGWPRQSETLRAGVERCQEAVARTEQLAGRLDSVRARVQAAQRREELTGEAAAAGAELTRAREEAATAHERWLALKEQRLAHFAAELAEGLRPDEPCAVCGSPTHPEPARKAPGHVDRAAEEAALEAHRSAEEARAAAEGHLAVLRESLAAATAAAGDEALERLTEEYGETHEEYDRTRALASGLHSAREALAHAEAEHERRRAQRQGVAERAASRASLRDALGREQAALDEELSQARGEAGSVDARARQLAAQGARLDEAAGAARLAADSAARLKDADARVADEAFRAGFPTPSEAAEAILTDAAHRELQHRLDDRQREQAAVRSVLAEPETIRAECLPPADPAGAEAALRSAADRSRRAASSADAARERCRELDRLSVRATASVRQLGPLRQEYDRVAHLAALAAGTSADNERRMRLESYVLAARLEQVAAAATARLRRMSSGRYTLVHSDDRSGRGRSGLGLHVVDAWTGRERDTATLSGGESFFASLALALGLADVVTEEAGGVRLDTLFIDEGFGSLDEQTLDEVMDVLDALRERERSVGIVSHVADLRRRVHTRLEVVKERTGSVAKLRGAPD